MQRLEFHAMGCRMLAVVDSEAPEVADLLAEVPNWFATWEQHLSRFRPDSELMLLNSQAGKVTQVSRVMWDVLRTALWAAHWSEGLVIPTLLPELEQAGYTHSLVGEDSAQAGEQPSLAFNLPFNQSLREGWRKITKDAKKSSICLPSGTRLDLAGVAKSWAVEQALHKLQSYGPSLVDAGGDIALSGPRTEDAPWPIGITNPFMPEAPIEMLLLKGGGVATSGRDYRRWQQGDLWQHHIIDPRTGQPAQTDLVSVTVVGPSTLEADVAAKAMLILGSEKGLAWLESHPSLASFLVLDDGKVIYSHNLQPFLWQKPG